MKVGLKNKVEQIVTANDTALKYGSGLLDVFATPAMLALMENTCMKSVKQFLNKGEDTVGIKANINHIKATAIGKKVYCESILTKIDGKKLEFEVKAFDEDGEIGNGIHKRFIIDTVKFMRAIK